MRTRTAGDTWSAGWREPGGAPPQDFTSKVISDQEQVIAELEAEQLAVTQDRRMEPGEKLARVARLNMLRELAFDIIAQLMKAENENIRKIFQS